MCQNLVCQKLNSLETRILQKRSQDPMTIKTHSRGITFKLPLKENSHKQQMCRNRRDCYSILDFSNCPHHKTVQEHFISCSSSLMVVWNDNLNPSFHKWTCLSSVWVIYLGFFNNLCYVYFSLAIKEAKFYFLISFQFISLLNLHYKKLWWY